MKLTMLCSMLLASAAALAIAPSAKAETRKAYCTYIPNDGGKVYAMPCSFYQAQGRVVLTWQDGVVSEFMPVGGKGPGVYVDQNGGTVYRELLENGGRRFNMENGSIEVIDPSQYRPTMR